MAKNPLTLDQIAQGWVAEGGDPKWAVPMAKIALRESGGRVGINNRGLNKNGTVDWGLFQVNDIWRKDPVIGPMFRSGEILTQRGATKAAVRIFKVQGPRAWATYNPATDQKYLGSSFRPSRSTPPASTGRSAVGSAVGSASGGGASGGGGGLVTADSGGGVDVSALLETLQSQRRAPAPSTLQAPSFAAGPTMPAGYQALTSGGGPGPRADIGKLLSLVRTQGGGDTTTAAGGTSDTGASQNAAGASQSPVRAAGGTRTSAGRIQIAAGANRPGAKMSSQILGFVRQVAGLYGAPLTIGTGTNHNRLTINGTVSDHWSGNGADIPLTGRALIKAGQDALIAAGMPAEKARRQTGGGYNVGGYQVIFNTNAPGWGNHLTHLHLGYRGGR